MNTSTDNSKKPQTVNRCSHSARSPSTQPRPRNEKRRQKTEINSNAPKRTARNRRIKAPNAGGVVESNTSNSIQVPIAIPIASLLTMTLTSFTADIRFSCPQSQISIVPSPLHRPSNQIAKLSVSISHQHWLTT